MGFFSFQTTRFADDDNYTEPADRRPGGSFGGGISSRDAGRIRGCPRIGQPPNSRGGQLKSHRTPIAADAFGVQ
jgi:hypothetical protein